MTQSWGGIPLFFSDLTSGALVRSWTSFVASMAWNLRRTKAMSAALAACYRGVWWLDQRDTANIGWAAGTPYPLWAGVDRSLLIRSRPGYFD